MVTGVSDGALSDLTDAVRAKVRALASRARLVPGTLASELNVHEGAAADVSQASSGVSSAGQALLDAASQGVDLSF